MELKDGDVIREGDEYLCGLLGEWTKAKQCIGMTVKKAKREFGNVVTKVRREGSKKMNEKIKDYPKGKKVYVQFNCPDNDDDFMMEGSFDPKKLNENHPFAECTIGDLKHIVITKSVKKVK